MPAILVFSLLGHAPTERKPVHSCCQILCILIYRKLCSFIYRLHSDFGNSIEYLIDFINYCIESYVNSDSNNDQIEEVDIIINGSKTQSQYCSQSLWNLYRGVSDSSAPSLLQSLHMALEKFLLDCVQRNPDSLPSNTLIYLLERSKSSSLTAVVASIVVAYPNLFFDVSLILMSNCTFLLFDRLRSISGERTAKMFVGVESATNHHEVKFRRERMDALNKPHRSMSLDDIILRYQIFKEESMSVETFNTRKQKILETIDALQIRLENAKIDSYTRNIYELEVARIDSRKLSTTFRKLNDKTVLELRPVLDEKLLKQTEEAQKLSEEFLKYMSIKLWADNKIKGQKIDEKYAQYENNPHFVISETILLIEELKISRNEMKEDIPSFACSAIIRFYSERITDSEMDFCKMQIIEFASAPLTGVYDYQISDGVEVAINSLPKLIELYPNEKEELSAILCQILYDKTSIGNYKKVCEYSIEAIQQQLWSKDSALSKSIIAAFIHFSPDYIKEMESQQLNEQRPWGKSIYNDVNMSFNKNFRNKIVNYLKDPEQRISIELNLHTDIKVLFLLVPVNYLDRELSFMVTHICKKFSQTILHDTKDFNNISSYSIFTHYAKFILNREIESIDEYNKYFVEEFNSSMEMANYFQALISVEDKIQSYDVFWTVWLSFYDKITDPRFHRNNHFRNVIHNYLLAWNWWSPTAQSWPSIKPREIKFYESIVKDIGYLPAVFNAISKFLIQVGSVFQLEGIKWISELVKLNRSKTLETNTISYVERFIRIAVFKNREKIKKEITLQENVLIILNFLVDKGSVNAYLIREDII